MDDFVRLPLTPSQRHRALFRSILFLATLPLAVLLPIAQHEVTASTPLAALAIRLTDLRRDYMQTSHEYTYSPDLGVSKEALVVHGFAGAYAAEFMTKSYVQVPGGQHLAGILSETLSRFADAGGAHWAFLRVTDSQSASSTRSVAIGDETVVTIVPYEYGSDWRGIWMVMHRKRYLYGFTLFKSSPDMAAAVTLARLVDRRIQRDG